MNNIVKAALLIGTSAVMGAVLYKKSKETNVDGMSGLFGNNTVPGAGMSMGYMGGNMDSMGSMDKMPGFVGDMSGMSGVGMRGMRGMRGMSGFGAPMKGFGAPMAQQGCGMNWGSMPHLGGMGGRPIGAATESPWGQSPWANMGPFGSAPAHDDPFMTFPIFSSVKQRKAYSELLGHFNNDMLSFSQWVSCAVDGGIEPNDFVSLLAQYNKGLEHSECCAHCKEHK